VLIGGHEYFAKKLVRSLSDYDAANTYTYLEPMATWAAKIRRAFDVFASDAVYFVGGTVLRNKVIDLALFLRKPVVMHWVGTDVTIAVKHSEVDLADRNCIQKVTHLCEVSWIQDELKQIGINAQIVQLAALDSTTSDIRRLPAHFSVLSYVREGREEFYGINELIRVAVDLPFIEVRIAGISHYHRPLPGNVKLLGWKENMLEEYRNCVLYLRLPIHDGLSFSVLEALSHGRYVGYCYEYPHTIFIDSYSRLKAVVQELYDAFKSGLLGVNDAGVEFVGSQFSRQAVLGTLVTKLGEATLVQ
jgi:hypothetical protein